MAHSPTEGLAEYLVTVLLLLALAVGVVVTFGDPLRHAFGATSARPPLSPSLRPPSPR